MSRVDKPEPRTLYDFESQTPQPIDPNIHWNVSCVIGTLAACFQFRPQVSSKFSLTLGSTAELITLIIFNLVEACLRFFFDFGFEDRPGPEPVDLFPRTTENA